MVFIRGDPCGIICLLMTYGAVLYADYVVVRWIILQSMNHTLWGSLHVVLFNVIVFLLFMAHGRAVFSDPGIVPAPKHKVDFSDIHSESDSLDWTVCTRCEMFRPPRAYHCRICRRCIRRMDHHCPWINNCVGEWNQKFFLQFLFYVGILSAYSIGLVASSWYIYSEEGKEDVQIKQTRILHSVILVLESVLFGMFVIAIGCDQFEAIFSDETLVEQAKRQGPYRPNKPKLTLLAEVCGRGHPLSWLLPCYSAPVSTDNFLHPLHSSSNTTSTFTV